MRKLLLPLLLLALCYFGNSQLKAQQNVGIGTTTPNPNAILHLDPNSPLGFLMPKLSAADTGVFGNSPANTGIIYYDTTAQAFRYFDGTYWTLVGTGTGGAGTDGRTVLNGTIDPTPGDGVDGDFYINTTTYNIFGPKTAGVWGAGTQLIGPAGADGLDGDRYATTSTTTLTIALGPQSLTVDTALAYTAAQTVIIAQSGTNFMEGTVTTYNASTGALDVNVTSITGAGIFSSWTVNLAGAPGPAGADGNTILSGLIDPTPGDGVDGDFYINTTTDSIFGPKTAGVWGIGTSLVGPAGAAGTNGIDGNTILSGLIDPTPGDGVDGDFFINTTTDSIFGPKTAGAWGTGTSLVGPAGSAGANGIDGNTILSGLIDPTPGDGVDGDFYINTTTDSIFGPKTAGAWGTGTSLVGPAGAAGTNGIDGNTILSGLIDPTPGDGVDGDFFINTTTDSIFGPKTAGAWGTGTSLIGPAGAAGTNGIDGNTILSGLIDPTPGDGVDGDFYINTTTDSIFGPKTAGVWGTGTSLVGPAGSAGTNGIDGNTILSGLIDPTPGDGVDGDFFINTTTDSIFGPKTAGAWGTGTSLVGPAGAAGTDGADGDRYATSSTTTLTISLGPQSLTVDTALAYTAAQTVIIAESGTNFMEGTVTTYNPSTGALDVNVTSITGGGTFSSWTVNLAGAPGPAGNTILSGLIDPTPGDGVDGDFFINTTTDSIFGPKTAGVWGTGTSLVGPAGAAGTNGIDGNTILSGLIDPTPGDGVDGDFFINTTTDSIFGPKTAGVWGTGTSLVGPAGAAGANGLDGNTILSGLVDPTPGDGVDGDFYINTTTDSIFGPKTAGAWGTGTSLVGPTGAAGANGIDGNTILSGLVDPTPGDGVDGDFYINTTTDSIFGPKTAGAWGTGTSLVGPTGAAGANGIDGNTILSGLIDPTPGDGVDGDFFINTTTDSIFGPKTAGVWGTGTSLVGPAGAAGTNGIDGNTILSGLIDPTPGDGVDGDFFINTTTDSIFGPKTAGAWGTGTSLIGPAGAAGTNGIDGNTILSGLIDPTPGDGVDGDFYINTTTDSIFGPKTAGVWGTGTSLVGPAGAAGTNGIDGNTILSGLIDPTPGDGVDGDFFINTTTDSIFGPKTAGVWGTGTSLVGPAGTDGNTVLNGLVDPTPGDGVDGDFYINTASDSIFGPKAAGVWPPGEPLVRIGGANDTIPANVFSARIENNGAVSITSQSYPFIQNVVRNGVGDVTINFTPGFFTEAPSVSGSVEETARGFSIVSGSVTASSVQIHTRITDNGIFEDRNFTLIAQRQGADYQNSLTAPPNVVGYWQSNGTDIYFDTAQVGIGTNTPAFDLDVAGNVNAQTGLYLEGSRAITNDGFGRIEFFAPDGLTEVLEFNGFYSFFQNNSVLVGTQMAVGPIDPAVDPLNINSDLELRSKNKGLLLNRVDTSFMTLLPADRGLLVYDTLVNELLVWNGSAWESATDIGATATLQSAYDAGQSINMGSGNIDFISSGANSVLYIDEANERVGIGNTSPANPLDVLNTTNASAINAVTNFNAARNEGINSLVSGSASENFGISGRGFGGTLSIGVNGEASNASSSNIGVRGVGFNTVNTGWVVGVQGEVQGVTTATNAFGLNAVATATGATNNYGVYSSASGGTNNYAGYFADGDVVAQNGNVGIGTITPANKLEVIGDAAKFDSVIIVNGAQNGYVLTSNASGEASWQSLPSSTAWDLLGNSGTVDGTNFIGTTDAVALSFRVNGNDAGRIGVGAGANAFFGLGAGQSANNNVNSVGIGTGALQNLSTGVNNTSVGYQSLLNTVGGVNNTALGYQALQGNVGGGGNVAVGVSAGATNITGSSNTFIGGGADAGAGGLSNASAIGANAIVGASNSLVLGNNANVGIGISIPASRLQVEDNVLTGEFVGRFINTNTGSQDGAAIYATSIATAANFGYGVIAEGNYIGVEALGAAGGFAALRAQSFGAVTAIEVLGNPSSTSGIHVDANGATYSGLFENGDLSLQGNVGAGGFVLQEIVNSNADGQTSLDFVNDVNRMEIRYEGSNFANNSLVIYDDDDSEARLIIDDATGDVAIGDYAPDEKLDVTDSIPAGWVAVQVENLADDGIASYDLETDVGYYGIGTDASSVGSGLEGDFYVANYNLGSTPLVIADNDNVGIGTITPSNKLEVVGDAAKFDSVIIVNGAQTGYVLTSNATGEASWQPLGASTFWDLTGNAGTVDGTNFIGTTDGVPLSFRINNTAAGRIAGPGTAFTSLGYLAGNNGAGFNNTAFGFQAMAANTADGNTAFGSLALENNTGSDANTGIGYAALRNIIGTQNTAVGNAAMENSTSGNDNVAMGYLSLLNNNDDGNVAIGSRSALNTDGQGNTAIGYQALTANVGGTFNVALGHGANVGAAALTNAIAIGYNALVDQSNSIVLGDTSTIRVGIGTTAPQADLHVQDDLVNLRLQSMRTNSLASVEMEFGRTDGIGNFVPLGSIGNPGSSDNLQIFTPNGMILNTGFSPRLTIGGGGTINLPDFAGSGRRLLTVNNSGDVGSIDLSDSINWARNGTDIYNTNTGNVGIGTSTPSQNLTVSSTGATGILVEAANNAFISLDAGTNTNTSNVNFRVAGSTVGRLRYTHNATPTAEQLEFRVNGADRMIIDGNGNAAIGNNTIAPVRFYNYIEPGNSTVTANISNSNYYNGASSKFGTSNFLSSDGTGEKFGVSNNVNGNAGSAFSIFGTNNTVDHPGNGYVYGTRSIVSKPSAVNGFVYGDFIEMDNDGNFDGYMYYGSSIGSGGGTQYGIYLTGEDDNYFSGNVGIGVTSPNRKLEVNESTSNATAAEITNEPSGVTSSISGTKGLRVSVNDATLTSQKTGIESRVSGDANATKVAVFGESDGGGSGQSRGVVGSGSNSTGVNYGLMGFSNGNVGTNYGVYSNVAGTQASSKYLYYGTASGNGLKFGIYMTGEDRNYLSGRLGIGTLNPGVELEVENSSSAITPQVVVENTSTGDAAINIRVSAQDWAFGIDNSDLDKFKIAPSSLVSTSTAITIESNGEVGIGTTTPANDLDVEGSVAIGASYSGTSAAPTNGMIIEGLTGIGTASPSTLYMLEVEQSSTARGILIDNNYTGGSTQYSLLIDNNNAGAGTDYGIYVANETRNYFSGSVGIGTTLPSAILEVQDNTTTANPLMEIQNLGLGDASLRLIAGNTWTLGVDNSDVDAFKISDATTLGTTNTFLTIETTGDAAFGGNTGGFEFHDPVNVSIAPQTLTINAVGNGYADNSPAVLELYGGSGGVNDEIGAINFTNLDPGNVNDYNFARISAHRENSNSTYSSLRFYTRQGAIMTEAMRIDEDARLGIGTTFANSKLHVNRTAAGEAAFRVQNNGSSDLVVQEDGTVTVNTPTDQIYDFYVSGSAAKTTGTAWTNVSDKRLKSIDGKYMDGLNIIRKINPVWFRYNGKAGIEPSKEAQVGIIAQDLKEIAPYTVSTFSAKLDSTDKEKTELLNFDFNAINYAQINAIKELADQVDQLKIELEAKNQEIESLKQTQNNVSRNEFEDLKAKNLELEAKLQKVFDLMGTEVSNK